MMTTYFSFILFFLITVLFILAIISTFSKNVWFCNTFGWHKAPTGIGFDGCSRNGDCRRCGKHVLQDSQGNWFS